MNYFSVKKVLTGIVVVLMLVIYYKHPFRYFYKTPWEMFGLTKTDQNVSQNPASIDISNWKTHRNDQLGIEIKYPDNLIFTKRFYPEPGVTDDQYSSYIFSNKPVLPTGAERGSFDEASIKSQGVSTLSIEKAYVNSTNNPRGIIAVVSEDAKEDLERFVKEWRKVKNYSIENVNGIKILKTKPEEINLFSVNVQGRGYGTDVFLKSKDGNFIYIRIFVNVYDKTSGAIFKKMVSTIAIL